MLDYVKKTLFSKSIKFGEFEKTIEFYTYPKYTIYNNSKAFEVYRENLEHMPKRLVNNGFTTWYELYGYDNYCIFFEYNGYEFAFDADLNLFEVTNFLHKGGVNISLLATSYIFEDNTYYLITFRDMLWNDLYDVGSARPIFEYIYLHIFDFFQDMIQSPIAALIVYIRKYFGQTNPKILDLPDLKEPLEFKIRYNDSYKDISFINAALVEYNDIIYLVDAVCNFRKVVYYPLEDLAFLEYEYMDYEVEEELIRKIEEVKKKKTILVRIEGNDENDVLQCSDKYDAYIKCFLTDITDPYLINFYTTNKKTLITNNFRLLDGDGKVLYKTKNFKK